MALVACARGTYNLFVHQLLLLLSLLSLLLERTTVRWRAQFIVDFESNKVIVL